MNTRELLDEYVRVIADNHENRFPDVDFDRENELRRQLIERIEAGEKAIASLEEVKKSLLESIRRFGVTTP